MKIIVQPNNCQVSFVASLRNHRALVITPSNLHRGSIQLSITSLVDCNMCCMCGCVKSLLPSTVYEKCSNVLSTTVEEIFDKSQVCGISACNHAYNPDQREKKHNQVSQDSEWERRGGHFLSLSSSKF